MHAASLFVYCVEVLSHLYYKLKSLSTAISFFIWRFSILVPSFLLFLSLAISIVKKQQDKDQKRSHKNNTRELDLHFNRIKIG